MTPIKLTVVLTHPIQYYAPWFRQIEAEAPAIALTVLHAIEPTPEQQGVGFDRAFEWDVPLTSGYRCRTVRPPRPGDQVDSSHFAGLDVPKIAAAIADTDPDVVLVPGWYSITLVRAIAASRRLRVPLLYRGDTHLQSGPSGWKRAPWAIKTWWLLRQFDGYLSTGRRVRTFLARFGAPGYRVFDAPPAVDNERFASAAAAHQSAEARAEARRQFEIAPDAFVPLFVGKLVERKRPLDLVRAAAALGPKTSLLVVGSGPLESAMRDEARRLGVDLRLAGFLNQTELGRAYAVADCLALSSDSSETWGLVVNEALATGLPCVVSDAVGCAPDLVRDGETGYVHPLGDVDALAAALATVRRRSAGGHRWAAACREAVRPFRYAEATAALTRACRAVLRHSPGPEPDWRRASMRVVACCGQMVIVGGLERQTLQVLRVLGERGALTHCIVNGWENFRITPLAEAVGASWSVGPDWYPLGRRGLTPLKLVTMMWEVARVSRHLLREARRIRPTHVFVPEYQTILRNLPALLWLRARGVKVVARLANAPGTGTVHRLLWRWIINPFVDAFVCNSAFTLRELLAHGVPAAKARVVTNMVPPRAHAWDPNSPRISGRVIFVGQIIPEKGLDLLLEAIALLRARGLDVSLDIVGDIEGWEGPEYRGYRATLRARAARPDLADVVSFLGWREDVPSVMAQASVHCCPSRPESREAFGIVVLEAKTSGLPSVVSSAGNLPDLVHHRENGWVCTDMTAAALAEGIAYFVTNRGAREAAGRAAHASAEEYSPERFAREWSDAFAAAVGPALSVRTKTA